MAHRPVAYRLYPDEGHGLARAANRLAFYAVADVFLAQYLGGTCAPLGAALVGSSTAVVVDTVGIPGLAAAVGRQAS